jgi:hypothetical protein
VTIAGHTGRTPAIDGERRRDGRQQHAFTVPVNVTGGGTCRDRAPVSDLARDRAVVTPDLYRHWIGAQRNRMPRIELELDDKGEIVGDAPEGAESIFTRIETAAHGQGYGKGVAKAAEDAKKQIADTVAAELAKKDALLPVERAKWAQIDEDNKSLQTRLIETTANTTGRSRRARKRTHENCWTGRMR